MLLAIDIGNTNIVMGLGGSSGGSHDGLAEDSSGDRPSGSPAGPGRVWRLETGACADAAACRALFADRLGASADDVDDCVIASVVPSVLPQVRDAARGLSGRAPLVVGDDGVELGIRVNIDAPEQAGADRLVNAVATGVHHPLPCAILDFGTATTLDVVGKDGAYEGGIIAPGVALSIKSLEAAAEQLPGLEIRRFTPQLQVLGKDTASAMESGVFWGYVAMIEGLVSRLRARHGEMSVIATGGLAQIFAEHLPCLSGVDDGLTLKGLFEIYARNRGEERRRAPTTKPNTG